MAIDPHFFRWNHANFLMITRISPTNPKQKKEKLPWWLFLLSRSLLFHVAFDRWWWVYLTNTLNKSTAKKLGKMKLMMIDKIVVWASIQNEYFLANRTEFRRIYSIFFYFLLVWLNDITFVCGFGPSVSFGWECCLRKSLGSEFFFRAYYEI